MTINHTPGRRPAARPIRPRRYPAAYAGSATVRPSGPDIHLVVGPLPIRVIRTVWFAVRRLFSVPAVPTPLCVPTPGVRPRAVTSGPRCLHCKMPMAEQQRQAPNPHGVWAVFVCRSSLCAVCQGPCRNQARMFLPPHWQSGRPGEITRL
jgi:hypothetical protein